MLKNRYPLGFFPTPLHQLSNLSKLYGSYNVYIKRDDQTGLASGGNKTRKLEYFLFDALRSGADTVITGGAQQSNHCRQTAAACAKAGLKCHLVLGGEEPATYSGNLLLSKLLGAVIHFSGNRRKGEDIPDIKARLEATGAKCYMVPYGGSNRLGALGYVNAMLELKEQMDSLGVGFDAVFFASSSGGTQAGMIVGKHMAGIATRLMPVSIDKEFIGGLPLHETMQRIGRETAAELNLDIPFTDENTKLIEGYDDAGYGVITPNETKAIRLLAETEGILLDPVYTARAFYGMTDQLEKGVLPAGANVLFWHTGGLPANFYYEKELQ